MPRILAGPGQIRHVAKNLVAIAEHTLKDLNRWLTLLHHPLTASRFGQLFAALAANSLDLGPRGCNSGLDRAAHVVRYRNCMVGDRRVLRSRTRQVADRDRVG